MTYNRRGVWQIDVIQILIHVVNEMMRESLSGISFCDKYIYLYKELLTLYNKVSFVNFS